MQRSAPLLCLFACILFAGTLRGQGFELGITAPENLVQNSTFEAQITLTSRGIPTGQRGVQGWSLGVAHEGLTLVSVTTAGTVVEELARQGLVKTEITVSGPNRPDNDGFVSGVILVGEDQITLPEEGTVIVARATYHVEAASCFEGARLAVVDGLRGSGVAIDNLVTWQGQTHFPAKSERTYPDCAHNKYRLGVEVPENPLPVPVGERRRVSAVIRLAQEVAAARAWTLAVSHDPARLQLLEVTLEGTGLEDLVEPDGFALFELTGGPGNTGFTMRAELAAAPPWAVPALEHPIARAEYDVRPILDPSQAGRRIETRITFPGALESAGGPVVNAVLPEGELTLEPLVLAIDVLPPTRFIRGDANGDASVDLADPVAILFHLYGTTLGAGPDVCDEAANANDDQHLDLTDVIDLLERLFLAPNPFPRPWPECGEDSSFPSLGCTLTEC